MVCWIAVILVSASSPANWAGQTVQSSTFAIQDNVDLVLLDVGVTRSDGSFGQRLSKHNFVVYDNGREQKITQFSSADAPVTVGLIVDNSGSMRPKRSEVVMAGLSFAKFSNPHDEYFVINFNDRVYPGLPPAEPFTDRIESLRSALFLGTPAGRTSLYDAIATGLRQLARGHREIRTLIVVSDGGDNASQMRLPELIRLITTSRATVFAVGLLDPDDRDLNPRVLQRIAALSGGGFFAPKRPEEVLPVFRHISDDIRHRYTIGFVPPQEDAGNGLHRLNIRVHDEEGAKYQVHARTSYRTSTPSKS